MFYLLIGGVLLVAPAWCDYDDGVFTSFAMVLLYLIGPVSTGIDAIPVDERASDQNPVFGHFITLQNTLPVPMAAMRQGGTHGIAFPHP